MNTDCQRLATLLGTTEVLAEQDLEHAANCSKCSALQATYGQLDWLLSSEPAPLAPLGFAQSVMAAVAALDPRAELRTARLQALIALAAAVLLTVLGTWGLPTEGAEPNLWVPDHQAALLHTQTALDGLSLQLEQMLEGGLSAAPSPPVLLLWLVGPALLVLNWVLSRGRPAGRLTS